MDDAFLVRRLQRLGELPGNRDGVIDGNRAPLQSLRQVLARHELHHDDVDGAAVVESGRVEAVDRAMPEWFSEARSRASRSKRPMRSTSAAKAFGSSLSATSRPSRVSVARKTSPIPPAPIAAVIR